MIESPFLIGEWHIEPRLNRVIAPAGSTETLEPRTMKVLVQLARSKPQVVTREQLLDAVWEDSVVTEHSLTIAISDLRKLFNDDPKVPAFIETIRGVGYRLIAPVSFRIKTPHITPSLSVPHMGDGLASSLSAKPALSGIKKTVLGVAALVLFGFAAMLLQPKQEAGFVIREIKPLTTMSGVELSPAFSPDGQRVAFVAFPDSGDVSEIYVQQLGTGAPVKFTEEAGAELLPTWSPDGQFLVYLSYGENGCTLQKKPSFGGSSLKLRDIDCQLSGMAWSPDGEALMISRPDENTFTRRLYRMDFSTLELTPVTNPPASYNGDLSPTFSPDGTMIAFVRSVNGSAKDIYLLNWQNENAQATRFTYDGVNITGFDWTADGESIVIASSRNGAKGLWQIPLDNPEEPLFIRAVSVDDPGSIALARSGRKLVYIDWIYEVNTWRMSLVDADIEEELPVIVSTRADYHPAISSNQKVAFVSTRSGASEIWTSGMAGEHPIKLTDFDTNGTLYPAWSPDGGRIAFEARSEGQADIYVIESAGGMPVKVTENASQDSRPSWSADGKSLYFGSDRSGEWQIWQASLETGATEQITFGGGIAGWEGLDGQFYYLRSDTTGIWTKSLEENVESFFLPADPSYVSLTETGLFYLAPPSRFMQLEVMKHDFEQGTSSLVKQIPVKPLHFYARWGFAVSPDTKWLFFSQVDQSESDLMLTEGDL